ncbi:MAG: AtpZ/AtpI family protein [Desulfobacterales bacterium]
MGFNYKKNQPWVENLSIILQLGLTMAGCIFFCFFIGKALDAWFGTKGVFITIFIFLGIIGVANVVYRQILQVTAAGNTEKPKDEPSDKNRNNRD